MILTCVHNPESAKPLLESGIMLASRLNKEFRALALVENTPSTHVLKNQIGELLIDCGNNTSAELVETITLAELAHVCDTFEASLLLIQWEGKPKRMLRSMLKICRDLRIPYLFFKDNFRTLSLSKIMVSVGFLVEEYEKAQFASAFGRFCKADILILQANDSGSKAANTVVKMKALFDKFELRYEVEKAKSDSFSLDKEAVRRGVIENYDMALISASREYGLDDILFGAREYHLIRKSNIPLLIINPRGDLYSLCD